MKEDSNNRDENQQEVSMSEKEKWMEKWNISEEQLKEAIVRTDSKKAGDIEIFLINHKYI